jgi:hypothetical protein
MVPATWVVIGFIALMGLFTFGSGDVKEYKLQMVEVVEDGEE